MPFYHRWGEIPQAKHTTFYKRDGVSLYREELFSSKGFSGIYSTKYHLQMPTKVLQARELSPERDLSWPEAPVLYCHFETEKKKTDGDFISARNVFLENEQCVLSTAHPNEETDSFYRNAYATEYIFVHRGEGELLSEYGRLPFVPGDQLIIPRSIAYQLRFKDFEDNKVVIIESPGPIEIPRHYRNEYGQLTEDAPYSERDIKIPQEMAPIEEKGEFRLVLKMGRRWFEHILPYHPFDVVGWDGFLYPFSLNIKDFHPKVGRLHLPPPVHLVFSSAHFVLCNFVPRPFDFHPRSIPAPYFHANIDSDEVLYYVEGDFMSRKGIKEGSITLHPAGMPHGPQPGKTEASIGATETNEYALMLDTFAPLRLTRNVEQTMDPHYPQSWLEDEDR